MGLFRKKEIREEEVIDNMSIEDPLLRAILEKEDVSRNIIMNIPAVSACVNRIADTVSSIKIRMYEIEGDRIIEVDDYRVSLLNDETGDTLDASQFKKAMVTDMLLDKGGYAYVNKVGNEIKSIHYVEANRVGFIKNSDPIFTDYQIQVHGKL